MGKVSHERVLELFTYEPDTGKLINRIKRSRKIVAGTEAGCLDSHRYAVIRIDKRQYYLHRIIWFWLHGTWPLQIDHRDGNKKNNRKDNLRESTRCQNQHNTQTPKNNTSGVKGVCWDKRRSMWMASLCHQNKRIFAGYFKEVNQAAEAIQAKRQELHGQFANHG